MATNKRVRTTYAELEGRIARAKSLIEGGVQRSEVVRLLAQEYGVTIRQARRYVSPREDRRPRFSSRREWRASYNKRRYDDPLDPFKVVAIMRATVNVRIKYHNAKKCGGTMELVGCSVQELCNHLEALFEPGMTWDNWGRHGWHVDHIRPCASFDLTDLEQQKQCFHYTNLQPMWAKDNREKWATWDGHAPEADSP